MHRREGVPSASSAFCRESVLIAAFFAVARSQYSGAELKKALRHDIDDLARNKALQVTTLPCLAQQKKERTERNQEKKGTVAPVASQHLGMVMAALLDAASGIPPQQCC